MDQKPKMIDAKNQPKMQHTIKPMNSNKIVIFFIIKSDDNGPPWRAVINYLSIEKTPYFETHLIPAVRAFDPQTIKLFRLRPES